MFLGTYFLKFSGKGRVILPKKIRNQLNKLEIFLIKGIDGGLWGFSAEEWQKFASKQLEQPLTNKEGRVLRRNFFPSAEACELDEQGRFVISEFLLQEFKTGEELIVVGAGDHFEIWSPNEWKKMVERGD